jgi:hypothetical protein
MDITVADWDQKITGIRTCEILFNEDETYEDYLKTEVDKLYEFIVVKVPVGNLKLVHQLEDNGFRYLENQLCLSFRTEQLDRINSVWYRLFDGFEYRHVKTQSEISSITEQVSSGMFEADRYSRDPLWQKDYSSPRYVNWIRSLSLSENVKFYIMVRKGTEIGFFAIKGENNKTNSCPIAGIYNQHKFSGYIFVLVWYILEISRKEGMNKFITSISSNNKNLLSSFSKAFNYRVDEIYIVLRKSLFADRL